MSSRAIDRGPNRQASRGPSLVFNIEQRTTRNLKRSLVAGLRPRATRESGRWGQDTKLHLAQQLTHSLSFSESFLGNLIRE